jgi:hypothetical protein
MWSVANVFNLTRISGVSWNFQEFSTGCRKPVDNPASFAGQLDFVKPTRRYLQESSVLQKQHQDLFSVAA